MFTCFFLYLIKYIAQSLNFLCAHIFRVYFKRRKSTQKIQRVYIINNWIYYIFFLNYNSPTLSQFSTCWDIHKKSASSDVKNWYVKCFDSFSCISNENIKKNINNLMNENTVNLFSLLSLLSRWIHRIRITYLRNQYFVFIIPLIKINQSTSENIS